MRLLIRRGEWLQLLREATAASCAGGNRPGRGTDEQARAARAVQLVQLGELSAAARALPHRRAAGAGQCRHPRGTPRP